MTIAVDIDDKLIQDGLELGGQATKEAMLSDALRDDVDRRARQKLVEAFGTFDFDPDYDPKAHR